MSKAEREQYWPLFKDCGFSREELDGLSDEDFNSYLTFLLSSQQQPSQEFNLAQDNFHYNDIEDDGDLPLEEHAKKIAKKCKNPYQISEFLTKGEQYANDFIQQFEANPVSYDSIIVDNEGDYSPKI